MVVHAGSGYVPLAYSLPPSLPPSLPVVFPAYSFAFLSFLPFLLPSLPPFSFSLSLSFTGRAGSTCQTAEVLCWRRDSGFSWKSEWAIFCPCAHVKYNVNFPSFVLILYVLVQKFISRGPVEILSGRKLNQMKQRVLFLVSKSC